MSDHTLSQRKKLILQAIIDSHIQNGEPVGSKSLTQNQHLSCSSATIRNEMAELEALGFLEQPHTSAGRVPTELGYRFYVDSLMQDYALSQGELAELNSMLKAKSAEIAARTVRPVYNTSSHKITVFPSIEKSISEPMSSAEQLKMSSRYNVTSKIPKGNVTPSLSFRHF